MYLMAEEFLSINGEGLNAGVLAHFIRLAGCPLKCDYCDTAWAQTKMAGKETSLEAIIELLQNSPANYVTLTGGEPLAAEGIKTLIEAILAQTNKQIEIETSGAVSVEPFMKIAQSTERLHFTVDYKLGSSGMSAHMISSNYDCLQTGDVIKYVIGSEADLLEAVAHHHLHKKGTAIFSPVYGLIEASRLVDVVKELKLSDVRIQLQLHKYIWEPHKQGV